MGLRCAPLQDDTGLDNSFCSFIIKRKYYQKDFPLPKTKTKSRSKSSIGLVKVGRLKFDKTLLIVIAAVVVATGGYFFYKGTHAAGANPYSCPAPQPTIEGFSQGTCVKFLQFVLKNYASQTSVTVSGGFDQATVDGVKKVQAISGLTQDGIVGPKTWAVINMLNAAHSGPSNWHYGKISGWVYGPGSPWNIYACKAQPFGYVVAVKAVKNGGRPLAVTINLGDKTASTDYRNDSPFYLVTPQASSTKLSISASYIPGTGAEFPVSYSSLPNCY